MPFICPPKACGKIKVFIRTTKICRKNPELERPPEISQEILDLLALNDPRDKKTYKKRQKYLEQKQKERIKKTKERKEKKSPKK